MRELDRIAAELNTTRESLAQAATLHFVPQQLHFSLSRQVECLVATTQFIGGRQQLITITYYFTDPAGTGGIADWYAARTPQTRAGARSDGAAGDAGRPPRRHLRLSAPARPVPSTTRP